ncbi:MAG: replication protein [Chitinophagales bacterium]|nr:replication protein [Chitinophagales bacterium]
MNHNYTPISNILFDNFIPTLTGAELKTLLIILRQTDGWQKERDKMTHAKLMEKTGLSRRVIADTIQSLINKKLIVVTDYQKNVLENTVDRKGKILIFYSSPLGRCAENSTNLCKKAPNPVQKSAYNKRNYTKKTAQKDFQNLGMQKAANFCKVRTYYTTSKNSS